MSDISCNEVKWYRRVKL